MENTPKGERRLSIRFPLDVLAVIRTPRHAPPPAPSGRRGVCLPRWGEEGELRPRGGRPREPAAFPRHVLQEVLARLDTAYPACCRRVPAGASPGFPRFQGRTRSHACTDQEFGTGARRDNGFLVLCKLGRVAVRWSRRMAPDGAGWRRMAPDGAGWRACRRPSRAPK